MDKTELSEKPARARVLRAADVIPPFDKDGSQPGQGEPPAPMPGEADAAATGAKDRRAYGAKSTRGGVGRAERPPFDEAEIPTYDLAENILTEQRQVAARRRRRPGRTEDVPVASFVAPSVATGSRTFVSEPSSRDLLELQQVVAEIVARDIERLCRKPSRQSYACP